MFVTLEVGRMIPTVMRSIRMFSEASMKDCSLSLVEVRRIGVTLVYVLHLLSFQGMFGSPLAVVNLMKI